MTIRGQQKENEEEDRDRRGEGRGKVGSVLKNHTLDFPSAFPLPHPEIFFLVLISFLILTQDIYIYIKLIAEREEREVGKGKGEKHCVASKCALIGN